MEQRCSDAVLCNPCAAGHFDSTRKKTMLIFADYTFRGWPLIREKRESLVPRKFRSIRYLIDIKRPDDIRYTATYLDWLCDFL